MRDNERIIAALAKLTQQCKETMKEMIEADASPRMLSGVTQLWVEVDCLINDLDDSYSLDRGVALLRPPMSEDLGLEILKRLKDLDFDRIGSDLASGT